MESYRASSVLGNLQKLGRRAARQLPKDPPLYSLHQNSNRLIGHRPPGPSILPHRLGAESRRTGGPSRPPTRNPAQVELHYLTQFVKLFLRRSLARRNGIARQHSSPVLPA